MVKLDELFQNYNNQDQPDSMLPAQRECSDIIRKVGLDAFSIYNEALAKTLLLFGMQETQDLYPTRNIFSTVFNAYVIGLANKYHPEWVRITPDKRVNRVYLEPVPGWHFYLKQLYGKDAKPDNVNTGNVKKINADELFENENDRIRIVYVGAVMNEKKKYQIDRVVASFVNTKNANVEWTLNMYDYVVTRTQHMSTQVETNLDSLITGKNNQQQQTGKTGTEDNPDIK